jgi:hypothetical protein
LHYSESARAAVSLSLDQRLHMVACFLAIAQVDGYVTGILLTFGSAMTSGLVNENVARPDVVFGNFLYARVVSQLRGRILGVSPFQIDAVRS